LFYSKQHTIRFHVDDLKSSHVNTKVNDEFKIWLNKMYGAFGEVKATRGKVHDYLGMTFDFSTKGKVIVDMSEYIGNMIDEFPIKLKPTDVAPTPAAEDLFAEGTGKKLDKEQAEQFHTVRGERSVRVQASVPGHSYDDCHVMQSCQGSQPK